MSVNSFGCQIVEVKSPVLDRSKMTGEEISMMHSCCMVVRVFYGMAQSTGWMQVGCETVFATGSVCGSNLHTAERAPIAPCLPDPFSLLHCSVSAMLQS